MSKQFKQFKYVIAIKPLGLMYASMGAFLSPQNLVGRSNSKFPPDSPTLSGIYARQYGKSVELDNLQLAGSFWSTAGQEQDFYVPTPFNCLVKDGKFSTVLTSHQGKWRLPNGKAPPKEKYSKYSWIRLSQWQGINKLAQDTSESATAIKVEFDPWVNLHHLHPRLDKNQRTVYEDTTGDQGSLFLENAVQLPDDVCLIYLANLPLEPGWYRFGGEGHLVEITAHELSENTQKLLTTPLGNSFALISPGVWGTNRQSHLEPVCLQQEEGEPSRMESPWTVEARLSDRPRPFRYRLGNRKNKKDEEVQPGNVPKLLSRGRYAVPPGTVYVLQHPVPSWYEWGEGEEQWFPTEGYSFKRWGCSLALPLSVVSN